VSIQDETTCRAPTLLWVAPILLALACSEPPNLPSPEIGSMVPREGARGSRIPVTLEGSGLHIAIESSLSDNVLDGEISLSLGGSELEDLVLVDEGQIDAVVPETALVGHHELTVTFGDGREARLDDAFFVRCTSSADCLDGAVCDPTQDVCAIDLPCAEHGDCGGAAYCADDGICAPNVSGGECDESNDRNGCILGEQCTAGYCGCGGDLFGIRVTPTILIVLDRSSSMNQQLPAGAGTKWDVARQAVTDLLGTFGGDANFGLMLYPGLNETCSTGMLCGPGGVFVDPAANTEAGINAVLSGASTCNMGTPTAESLEFVASYAPLQAATGSNYVLLITDGQSSCDDPVAATAALRTLPQDVRTFAVGFGSGADTGQLTGIANAGGTAQSGDPAYYQADDAAQLAAALAAIGSEAASCTYALSGVPPDPEQLFVYVGEQSLPRDPAHQNGWDYVPANNQIQLYGPACDDLQSGQAPELVISYGCADD